MPGLLNLGSLVLGLIAWILPVFNLSRRDKAGRRGRAALSAASFVACAAALCMQLFYADHLVRIEDWSALADTSHAAAWVSAVLLAVTVILNAVPLALNHGKNRKTDDSD